VSATGHLLYRRDCALLAAPFDPRRPALGGPAVSVENDVQAFAADDRGTLYIVPGCLTADVEIAVLDSEGARPATGLRQPYTSLALSPEGERVAVSVAEGPQWDIAVLELDGGRLTRLTDGPGRREQPAWTSDGERVAYSKVVPEELRGLYWTRADAVTAIEEPLLLSKEPLGGLTFTPDGGALAYAREEVGEVWLMPLSGESEPRRLVSGRNPRFSPDGRWLAYEATSPVGRRDAWIASYPDLAPRRLVSADGFDPVWARDGRALYFRDEGRPQRIMKASLDLAVANAPRVDAPIVLHDGVPWSSARGFDSVPGEERLLALRGRDPRPMNVVVVSSWAPARRSWIADWRRHLRLR
jgi:hypothetical protein